MGKIVISTNATLDGVVQDPDGKEGFELGGWFNQYGGKDLEVWRKVAFEEIVDAEALLLGRRSDEWFAERWQTRSGDWADRMNGIPKYVVSSTVEAARWSNSTVLTGDLVSAVAKLKQDLPGDVVVYASYQLARTLIQQDLVDELRLMLLPVVLGSGERLFEGIKGQKPFHLVDSRTLGQGLALLTFRPGETPIG